MQLVMTEVSKESPQALQAVKLLAQYKGNKIPKVKAYATFDVLIWVSSHTPRFQIAGLAMLTDW